MVAYGFKGRFVPKIKARIKKHTMRNERKRHVRVGESPQLYEKMRQKGCAKIIPDPECVAVEPVQIDFKKDTVRIGERPVIRDQAERDEFAVSDGFEDWEDLRAFWKKEHKAVYPLWSGVYIAWA
jgi:hypothetical protein